MNCRLYFLTALSSALLSSAVLAQTQPAVIPPATSTDKQTEATKPTGPVRQPRFRLPPAAGTQSANGNNGAIQRVDPNGQAQESNKPFEPVRLPPRDMTPQEIDELRKTQIDRATRQILIPEEIGKVKDRAIDAQGAAIRPWPSDVPNWEMVPLTSHVGHDHDPVTITLAFGMISPIIFKGERGQPWPIESIAYDPRQFSQDGNGCGGNAGTPVNSEEEKITFNMMPCQFQTYGNILVKLRNHPTPFVVIIRSGRYDYVDSPVTLKVHGSSPYKSKYRSASKKKKKKVVRKAPSKSKVGGKMRLDAHGRPYPDDLFDDFLDGVPPRGARRVATGLQGVDAYMLGNRLYMVGNIRVLAPSADAMAQAPGRSKSVFRIDNPLGRVLIADQYGTEHPINIAF